MLMLTSKMIVMRHHSYGPGGIDMVQWCGYCLSMKMLILTSKTDMVGRCGTAPIRPISLCERLSPEPYLAWIWTFSATDFTLPDFVSSSSFVRPCESYIRSLAANRTALLFPFRLPHSLLCPVTDNAIRAADKRA